MAKVEIMGIGNTHGCEVKHIHHGLLITLAYRALYAHVEQGRLHGASCLKNPAVCHPGPVLSPAGLPSGGADRLIPVRECRSLLRYVPDKDRDTLFLSGLL